MRLLLTRSLADSARTRAALEADGHRVLISPVLTFRRLEPVWPQTAFDAVVASSAQAFEAFAPDHAGQAAVARLPLFLVGRQTEAAARRHGFAGPATLHPDGAALAASLADGTGLTVLFLAGRDRKPAIEEGLAALGHHVHVVETYAAEAAPALTDEAQTALGADAIDGVLHYSRRSADLFTLLCRKAALDPRRFRHICLSDDVAAALRAAGCLSLHVAAKADDEAMRHAANLGIE